MNTRPNILIGYGTFLEDTSLGYFFFCFPYSWLCIFHICTNFEKKFSSKSMFSNVALIEFSFAEQISAQCEKYSFEPTVMALNDIDISTILTKTK